MRDEIARTRRRVLDLRAKGHSLTVIACMVGRSRSQVKRILAEARREWQARLSAS